MARNESEQRRKIVEAAIPVFAERGRKGATIRLVGRRAGVNSALIYYYFENKDTLFAEAIRHVLSGVLQRYQEQRRPLTSARDRLAWLVDGLFDYYSTHPERMRLMAVVLNLHPELFGRTLESFLETQVLVPLEVLAEGMRCGELRQAHPLELWWSILGVCLFSLMLQPIAHRFHPAGMPAPALDLAARRGQILDLLVNGIARPARRKKS